MTKKEKQKAYHRKWYLKNKEVVLKRQKRCAKEWKKNNRERYCQYLHEWVQNHPWYRSYHGAYTRCNFKGRYHTRKIKMLMTPQDFEFLWYRDNAHLMARPSIDRIDTKGNYTLDNCRFMELKDNMARRFKNE